MGSYDEYRTLQKRLGISGPQNFVKVSSWGSLEYPNTNDIEANYVEVTFPLSKIFRIIPHSTGKSLIYLDIKYCDDFIVVDGSPFDVAYKINNGIPLEYNE